MKKALFLLCSAGILAACNSKEPIVLPEKDIPMLVLNEGMFGRESASLSAITRDDQVQPDIFQQVNGRPLGGYTQSIAFIEGYYFVAVSGSNKIEVIKPESFGSVATISQGMEGLSPFYIVKTRPGEAVVSTQEGLLRIDTKEFAVKERIPLLSLQGQPEALTVVGNKLFCAIWKQDYPNPSERGLAVFDLDKIRDGAYRFYPQLPINSTTRGTKMILDRQNRLWITTVRPGSSLTFHCFDPLSETILKSIEVPFVQNTVQNIGGIAGTPWELKVDADQARRTLYVTLNRLWRAESTASLIPVTAVYTLDMEQSTFAGLPLVMAPELVACNGLAVSPDGSTVYLCDPLDYKQRGKLYAYSAVFSATAQLPVATYSVGIIPRAVHFTRYDQ